MSRLIAEPPSDWVAAEVKFTYRDGRTVTYKIPRCDAVIKTGDMARNRKYEINITAEEFTFETRGWPITIDAQAPARSERPQLQGSESVEKK